MKRIEKMIFAFLMFDRVLGSPRKTFDNWDLEIDDFNMELEAEELYIDLVGDIGVFFRRSTNISCPYTEAKRCDINTGTLFSRSKCEWLEYYEECDFEGSNKCHGYFKSLKDELMEKPEKLLEWKTYDHSYDDSIIYAIKNLFPGVTLEFEKVQNGERRSCLPTAWSGPETCDPVLEKGDFHILF